MSTAQPGKHVYTSWKPKWEFVLKITGLLKKLGWSVCFFSKVEWAFLFSLVSVINPATLAYLRVFFSSCFLNVFFHIIPLDSFLGIPAFPFQLTIFLTALASLHIDSLWRGEPDYQTRQSSWLVLQFPHHMHGSWPPSMAGQFVPSLNLANRHI